MQTQSVTQTTQKSGEQAELKQVWQRIEGNMPPAYENKKTITKADARE